MSTVPLPVVIAPPAPLTAFDLFFEDPATAALQVEAAIAEHGLLTSLPEQAPRLQAVALKFLTGQVVEQILLLLGRLPVGDMLTEGWAKLQKVAEARTATKVDLGRRNVSVLEHEIVFGKSPTIEMMIDEAPVPIVNLGLEARFSIAACEVEVLAGDIARVVPGVIGVAAVMRARSTTLFEHRMSQLDLTRLFPAPPPTSTPSV